MSKKIVIVKIKLIAALMCICTVGAGYAQDDSDRIQFMAGCYEGAQNQENLDLWASELFGSLNQSSINIMLDFSRELLENKNYIDYACNYAFNRFLEEPDLFDAVLEEGQLSYSALNVMFEAQEQLSVEALTYATGSELVFFWETQVNFFQNLSPLACRISLVPSQQHDASSLLQPTLEALGKTHPNELQAIYEFYLTLITRMFSGAQPRPIADEQTKYDLYNAWAEHSFNLNTRFGDTASLMSIIGGQTMGSNDQYCDALSFLATSLATMPGTTGDQLRELWAVEMVGAY